MQVITTFGCSNIISANNYIGSRDWIYVRQKPLYYIPTMTRNKAAISKSVLASEAVKVDIKYLDRWVYHFFHGAILAEVRRSFRIYFQIPEEALPQQVKRDSAISGKVI